MGHGAFIGWANFVGQTLPTYSNHTQKKLTDGSWNYFLFEIGYHKSHIDTDFRNLEI